MIQRAGEVRRIVGSRVHDEARSVADDPGVRPLQREHARVRREDADHPHGAIASSSVSTQTASADATSAQPASAPSTARVGGNRSCTPGSRRSAGRAHHARSVSAPSGVGSAPDGAAAAKNRAQPFWFFVPVLLAGFLPWTPLLGWLWRRGHWQSLNSRTQEAWLLLSVWAGGTFLLFSLNSAKLMHYILPMFPALAALVALRWSGLGVQLGGLRGVESPADGGSTPAIPSSLWRGLAAAAVLPLMAFPLACWFAFKVQDQVWVKFTMLAAAALLVAVIWESRKWSPTLCVRWSIGLAAVGLFTVVALVPLVETEFRSNQTLKPLGIALQRELGEGDLLIVRGRIPQGLPFYAHPAISATPAFERATISLVTLENFPGHRSWKSRRTSDWSSRVCRAATPFTAWLPTQEIGRAHV